MPKRSRRAAGLDPEAAAALSSPVPEEASEAPSRLPPGIFWNARSSAEDRVQALELLDTLELLRTERLCDNSMFQPRLDCAKAVVPVNIVGLSGFYGAMPHELVDAHAPLVLLDGGSFPKSQWPKRGLSVSWVRLNRNRLPILCGETRCSDDDVPVDGEGKSRPLADVGVYKSATGIAFQYPPWDARTIRGRKLRPAEAAVVLNANAPPEKVREALDAVRARVVLDGDGESDLMKLAGRQPVINPITRETRHPETGEIRTAAGYEAPRSCQFTHGTPDQREKAVLVMKSGARMLRTSLRGGPAPKFPATNEDGLDLNTAQDSECYEDLTDRKRSKTSAGDYGGHEQSTAGGLSAGFGGYLDAKSVPHEGSAGGARSEEQIEHGLTKSGLLEYIIYMAALLSVPNEVRMNLPNPRMEVRYSDVMARGGKKWHRAHPPHLLASPPAVPAWRDDGPPQRLDARRVRQLRVPAG